MISDTQLGTALTMFNAATSTMNTLWQFYSAVALATIGYVWSQKPEARGRAKLLLALGFLVFAAGNHTAFGRTLTILAAAEKVIGAASIDPRLPTSYSELLQSIHGPDPLRILLGQIALSAGVLAAVYFAHRRDRKG